MPDPIKTPLRHALDTLVNAEDQEKFLHLLHAGVQTCMSRSAVTEGKSNEDVAADSRCYGRIMLEIEGILGGMPNPFVVPRQQKLHRAVSPEEFERLRRENDLRHGKSQTVKTA